VQEVQQMQQMQQVQQVQQLQQVAMNIDISRRPCYGVEV
jgi:hypothetical protein